MGSKFSPCGECGKKVDFLVKPKPFCGPCSKKLRANLHPQRDKCLYCGGWSYTGNLCEECQRILTDKRKTYDEIVARNQSGTFRKSQTTHDRVRLDA